MNSKKIFFVMVGVFTLSIGLLISTVVVGDRFLQKQSSKLLSLKLDNQVVEAQQLSLTQAKKDLQKYAELDEISKQIVPQDKDEAKATREIIQLADQAGVKIAAINFPASTLGQAPIKAPKPTEGEAAPSNNTSAITQVQPVIGINNLYQLDIVVASDTKSPATYTKLIDFLKRLENNRRTAQVTQISIQPDTKNRTNLNFTLTITLYLKP